MTPPLRCRRIGVGIGLDTGEAIPVGDGYRGAALNLAARLCSLAGPGEVLARDTVCHLARHLDGLAYHERGLVDLKGFAEPVKVMQVGVAGTPVESPVPAGDDRPAQQVLPIGVFLGSLPAGSLVGRETELARVIAQVDAVQEGSGRVAVLAGEPAMSKIAPGSRSDRAGTQPRLPGCLRQLLRDPTGLSVLPFPRVDDQTLRAGARCAAPGRPAALPLSRQAPAHRAAGGSAPEREPVGTGPPLLVGHRVHPGAGRAGTSRPTAR